MNLQGQGDPSKDASMPESEKEMCERALKLFENNDIKEVVKILQSIQLGNPTDLTIRHNVAVAKFRERNTTESVDFYQELQDILNESYTEIEANSETEDYKYPVMVFNFAIVMYHYKQYRKALGVTAKLSSNLSSFMDGFAIRIKLLYIDLLLKLQQYDKALIEIEHFEIQLKCQTSQSSDTLSSGDTVESENNSSEIRSSPDAQESPNKEILNLLDDQSSTIIKLQQFKTFCSLSLKSMRAAKREYKILFSMLGPSSQNCIVSMYLKAYHDYLRGNFKKAAKIITSLPNKECYEIFIKTGDLLDMAYNNNFAACNFYQGKPVVASWYFQKALRDIDNERITNQKSGLPLHANSYNGRKSEIYYNFGIALLHAKQAQDAFKVLIACVRNGYFKNPSLWLRIAECCIQIAKPNNDEGFIWTDEKKKTILEVKRGNDQIDTDQYFTKAKVHRKVESKFTEPPEPTLGYASFCIENAIKLIESETVTNDWLNVKPGNPLTSAQEIISLQAACYITGAYIALSLENYPLLLKRCQELNDLPSLPPAYDYLCKQYLAECHFHLKDRKKAQEIYAEVQSQNLSNVNSQDQGNLYSVSPTTDLGEEKRESESSESFGNALKPIVEWFPKEEEAKMAVVHNRALTHVLVNEYDKAAEILKAYIGKSSNTFLAPDFLNLAVHVQIKLGNVNKAMSLLNQYSPGVVKAFQLIY